MTSTYDRLQNSIVSSGTSGKQILRMLTLLKQLRHELTVKRIYNKKGL